MPLARLRLRPMTTATDHARKKSRLISYRLNNKKALSHEDQILVTSAFEYEDGDELVVSAAAQEVTGREQSENQKRRGRRLRNCDSTDYRTKRKSVRGAVQRHSTVCSCRDLNIVCDMHRRHVGADRVWSSTRRPVIHCLAPIEGWAASGTDTLRCVHTGRASDAACNNTLSKGRKRVTATRHVELQIQGELHERRQGPVTGISERFGHGASHRSVERNPDCSGSDGGATRHCVRQTAREVEVIERIGSENAAIKTQR